MVGREESGIYRTTEIRESVFKEGCIMVNESPNKENETPEDITLDEEVPDDAAERPGTDSTTHAHDDELADEWGRESFPGSDPPAHY